MNDATWSDELRSVKSSGCPFCHAKPTPLTPKSTAYGIKLICRQCEKVLRENGDWTAEVWAQGV